MEPENLAVIDVESDSIDSPEPEDEEIWYSALQIQGLLKLSKAGLQQSISKLSEHLRPRYCNLTPWRCTGHSIL